MGFSFLLLPPLSRAVCLKWYLFLFVTAHRDCCLDILPSWHPDRYDTDAFGQKSEPVCSMPLRSHDACSASESPQCPGGEMERARGPQMNSRKRAGIIHSDPATHFQFKVFVLTSFFSWFFFLLSFLALLHLPVRALVSCFSPGGRVLGELGFCELEKECTSVWSALISVEKDLIVPGFWDHYLSFSFIKSVMRKFKIKGFVNWIPVWKGGTYQEVSTEACRWATGNNTRLEHLSLAAFDKDPVPRQGGGVVCGKASGYPEIFSSVNNIFPPLAGYLHLDLQWLLKRKGGLLAESSPRAVRPDSAEMRAGKSFHLLMVLLLICKEEELVLVLIYFFFFFFYLLPVLNSFLGQVLSFDSFTYNKNSNWFESSEQK